MAFIQGDLIRVRATFNIGGILTDPTTVTLKYKAPTGTITTWVYLTDNQLVRESVGSFYADISVTAGGTWNYRWEGTGAAQGANQSSFEVTATTI